MGQALVTNAWHTLFSLFFIPILRSPLLCSCAVRKKLRPLNAHFLDLLGKIRFCVWTQWVFGQLYLNIWASQVTQLGKESACSAGDAGRCEFNPPVRKIPWRAAWQPTPVFLPGKSHEQRSLVGCSLLGHRESDSTEATEHACTYIWIYKAVSEVFFPWWINQIWRGKQDIVPISPPNLELEHTISLRETAAYRDMQHHCVRKVWWCLPCFCLFGASIAVQGSGIIFVSPLLCVVLVHVGVWEMFVQLMIKVF